MTAAVLLVGLQIAGNRFADDLVLALAAEYEALATVPSSRRCFRSLGR